MTFWKKSTSFIKKSEELKVCYEKRWTFRLIIVEIQDFVFIVRHFNSSRLIFETSFDMALVSLFAWTNVETSAADSTDGAGNLLSNSTNKNFDVSIGNILKRLSINEHKKFHHQPTVFVFWRKMRKQAMFWNWNIFDRTLFSFPNFGISLKPIGITKSPTG